MARPDFYVGPTLVEKPPNDSLAASHRNAPLQKRMEHAKLEGDRSAKEKREAGRLARSEMRRAKLSRIVQFFTRGRLGHPRTIR